MKGIRTVMIGALALTVCAGFAQKKADPLEAEFTKLNQDYNKALSDYYKPFEDAKTDEEREKIKLDPAKDPTKRFFPKAVSLADRSKKNKSLFCRAGTFALRMAMGLNDQKTSDRLLGELEARAIDQPEFGHSLYLLDQYGYVFFQDRSKAAEWSLKHCDKIIAATKNREVKAAALMHKAEVYAPPYGESRDLAKGREIYVALRDKYGDTTSGKRAGNELFRIDHLQVGMVAPDFEATDESGKAFKLSEYRGQVVVLDFWGFW
ncbi:MAG: redoxin domain-containing protein [Armatimonadetes bacterium]|nr:redoxin domain-containing protein [Armatimonadota bacterium]